MTVVYTIGHSNLTVRRFLSLLSRHGIQRLVDVRSAPYSAWAAQFNKQDIERALTEAGFEYVYAGNSLGGRPEDKGLYTSSGVPDYERIEESEAFQDALEWLLRNAEEKRTAIMCSEADPFACHRERLIGRKLRKRGADVLHITSEGEIVVQEQGALF